MELHCWKSPSARLLSYWMDSTALFPCCLYSLHLVIFMHHCPVTAGLPCCCSCSCPATLRRPSLCSTKQKKTTIQIHGHLKESLPDAYDNLLFEKIKHVKKLKSELPGFILYFIQTGFDEELQKGDLVHLAILWFVFWLVWNYVCMAPAGATTTLIYTISCRETHTINE